MKTTGPVGKWIWVCGLIAWSAQAQTNAPGTPSVDEKEFREVLDLLRSQYADPNVVRDKELSRSALQAVLAQLGSGAVLMTQPSLPAEKPRPIQTELLPHKVGYWRLPTFQPAKGWLPLEKQLADWQKSSVIGLVLDLRDFEASSDYVGASHVAAYFTPPGAPLFSIQGLQVSQQVYQNQRPAQSWLKPLVVLINSRTRGAAEALAAVLRRQNQAILIGRSTAGQAALYAETKLSSGRYLRWASAQVVLGDGTKLFGQPVRPDVGLYVDDRSEREAMAQIVQGSAGPGVRELPARQRLSEAALVREDNPEIDAAYAQQRHEEEKKGTEPTQDVALLRALDVLRAIALAGR